MPRCVCGKGEMELEQVSRTDFWSNDFPEAEYTEWYALCPVCGAYTDDYASPKEAVEAFKRYDFLYEGDKAY